MAWLYQRDDSAKWWVGYRVNGRQFLRSTGTEDRAQAERELAKLEAVNQAHKAGSLTDEFIRLLTNTHSTAETLRGFVVQWLAECKDLSHHTLTKYRDGLEEFCNHVNANDSAPLL